LRSSDLQQKLDHLKASHDQAILDMKKEHEIALLRQKEQLKAKIHGLKN
jgi:hypothetical protein